VALKLSKDQLRAVAAKLRTQLAAGYSDHDICESLGLSWVDYEELKTKMLSFEATRIANKTSEEIYAEYIIQQETNINDLTGLITRCDEKNQLGSAVNAIKARADIYNQIIKVGQEFGFIDKIPEKTEVIAGVTVKNLSNEELNAQLANVASGFGALLEKYGERNMLQVDPGPIHFPDSPSTEQKSALPKRREISSTSQNSKSPKKAKRHARNPVHGGRRVVKTDSK
jgi:hypothetical protein